MHSLMHVSPIRSLWRTAVLGIVCSIDPVTAATVVEARRFVVTSEHPAATSVGMAVLESGGNVMDAAVATSLALGVAAPYGSGLGGKLVMLYRDGDSGAVTCVEALPTAPRRLDPADFAALPLGQQRHGYAPFCVPGLPAGLWEAHARWGSLPWHDLVMPAAELAEQGVEFLQALTPIFALKARQLRRDPAARRCYLVDGRLPHAGEVLRFPALAATLRQLADGGIEPFYRGAIAQQIVAAARAGGSPVTLEDFRSYRARFQQPLTVKFRGRRIITCPPPVMGGVTVLAALKTLEENDWSTIHRGERYVDTVSRVLLQLYPQVDRCIADQQGAQSAARDLLAPSSISHLRTLASQLAPVSIAARDTVPSVEPTLDDDPHADTSHLVVADSQGNIVCMTQSLSHHFGGSVVVPGTGILLNNSMTNFNVINTRSVNALAPGKRPRSALAPVIVEQDGQAKLALGIPGGQRIPSTTIQLLLDVIAAGEPLSEAFDDWRFHLRRPILRGEPSNVIDLEQEAPDLLAEGLRERGWRSVEQVRDGSYFGGGNGVQYLADGRLIAVADSRRTDAAGGE